jgi:DNA-binding transcriptional ArsR family regulator
MTDSEERLAQPREAFALLGHDIRLEILLALLAHWDAVNTEPQRYSELMRAVGMEDSGKFNYHLDKLRGVYLRKTGDGYVPTASATALYRAVLAHRPTETTDRTRLDPGIDCPECGAKLAGVYEREFFSLRCDSCDGTVGTFTYPLPKNGLAERTDREVLEAVYDRAREHVGLARRGQCPDCGGATTRTVETSVITGTESPVHINCDTCTWTVRTGFMLPFLTDARVLAALSAVGVTVEECFPWELPDPTATVTDTEPVQIDLVVMTDEGEVTITIDNKLSVRGIRTDRQASEQSI